MTLLRPHLLRVFQAGFRKGLSERVGPPDQGGRYPGDAHEHCGAGRRLRALRGVRNESELAEAIGGFNLPDSEPADVVHLLDAAGKPVTSAEGIRHALRQRERAVKALRKPAGLSEGDKAIYEK